LYRTNDKPAHAIGLLMLHRTYAVYELAIRQFVTVCCP